MNKKHILTMAIALSATAAQAAPIAIDLSTWQERGPAGNGNWVVAGDGSSVLQTINGDPTFFVSPTNQINTTIKGQINVQTTGDDDFIGFVLGFNGPASTGNDMDYLLFDWKQLNQDVSREGFALSRVNGTITNYTPGFWAHTDSTDFDVLATDFGTDRGWVDNTTYDFSILYQTSRVRIDIAGGAFGAGETVFDIGGSFSDGLFGFYNYSQASVRYAGLTEENTPPPPTSVPEPGPLALLGLALSGLTIMRQRSKKAS